MQKVSSQLPQTQPRRESTSHDVGLCTRANRGLLPSTVPARLQPLGTEGDRTMNGPVS